MDADFKVDDVVWTYLWSPHPRVMRVDVMPRRLLRSTTPTTDAYGSPLWMCDGNWWLAESRLYRSEADALAAGNARLLDALRTANERRRKTNERTLRLLAVTDARIRELEAVDGQ